jgi:hypothetical protein
MSEEQHTLATKEIGAVVLDGPINNLAGQYHEQSEPKCIGQEIS